MAITVMMITIVNILNYGMHIEEEWNLCYILPEVGKK